MQPGGCVCYFILSVREANWSGGLDQRQNGSTSVAREKHAPELLGQNKTNREEISLRRFGLRRFCGSRCTAIFV
jgi:hypothetical protein